MSIHDIYPRRMARCFVCTIYRDCYITENDRGVIEYYCNYCYATVPVKKLKTRSRKSNRQHFYAHPRYPVRIPRIFI